MYVTGLVLTFIKWSNLLVQGCGESSNLCVPEFYAPFVRRTCGGVFLYLYCCVNRFFSVFLAAFAGYSGIQYDDFSVDKFSNMHTFSALLVALISSVVYYALKGRGLFQMIEQHGMNTDSVYIAAIEGIEPAVIIIGFFSLLHQLFHVCFGVDGIQELMEQIFNYLLTPIKNGLGSGLIVIFLTHGLWFLGFHGHNMLDTVIKQHFTDVTAGIFSKTMQDVFVLLGGTGAMLCLVTAILLFARKKDVRHLASMAAPTVIFNISEIALFGIPVIFNPIFLVPFILVPIANFLITYGAIYSGIVPHVVNEVDWTTPILLSGYRATGSWRGDAAGRGEQFHWHSN